MTEQGVKKAYQAICRLLSEKKLKQAFGQISELIHETGQGVFFDQLYNLEQTYRYMLKYTIDGFNDPERQNIYRHLLVSGYELADHINEYLMTKSSQSFLYQKKRAAGFYTGSNLNELVTELEDLLINKELNDTARDSSLFSQQENSILVDSQKCIVRIFYFIFLFDRITVEQKKNVVGALESQYLINEYKSLLVTALTFSLLHYYDEAKLELLFELAERNDMHISIRQRSLTGLVIAFFQFDKRLPLYPHLTARLEILNENPENRRNLERIIIQLISTKETEKIRKRIQEEIIPEMLKITPNIQNKLNFKGLMEEGIMDDKNPEWSEIFSESPGLMEKMEELTRMQMEGADVFMSSFSVLKTFPFFNEFTNWFIPFFPDHPDIRFVSGPDSSDVEKRILESLLHSPILCNSDKYSFSLVLHGLPDQSKEMMSGVLKAEMEQLSELEKDEQLLTPDRKGEIASNQYIQDLYRFFKLHPSKSEFEDIFNWDFDFNKKIGFQKIIEDNPAIIRKMAEFYFEKGYYQEALGIFISTKEQTGETLQKAAYCYQKLGDFAKALETYRKAELYDQNKIWTLKKIALCLRSLKRPAEALEIYQLVEDLEPDNLNTHFAIGYCHTEAGQYQEALKHFFRIEYLSPGNKKVWRPIAWCSFLTGKYDQAKKYYEMLLSDNPDKYDQMNMGHVQWATGNRTEALNYYRQSVKTGGFSEAEFMASFDEDLQHLLSRGVQPDEVPIVLDQLRYSLEE